MIRLAVRVRREHAEIVLAELVHLAPAGVEEVEDGDVVEYAVYGTAGELPSLPDVRAAAGEALVEVSSTEVADDWADRWRAFHRPILVADRIHVRPPWEPALVRDGVLDLVVDPGRAFGTGAHHTTRLCLELLVLLEAEGAIGASPAAAPGPDGPAAVEGRTDGPAAPAAGSSAKPTAGPPTPVLDLGSGSGVLAVAAARLGCAPVVAVDHDEASVVATQENAAANDADVHAERFDLLRDGASTPPGPESLVLANLLRPLLLRVAADGFTGDPPRHLVASGLLRHETDEVVAAFAPLGLHETDRREDGEWAATLLRRD